MTVLRFCPACGQKLLKASLMNYCASCGQKLADLAGLAESPGAAAAKLPRNVHPSTPDADSGQRSKPPEPAEYYSVVLKSCGNQQRVTERLSKVLRRSITATRMAVELIPCLVLYKSKAAVVQAVTTIFAEERLHYTVVTGEARASAPAVPGLDQEMQYLLKHAPAGLWLGEFIRMVIPSVERKSGFAALIATDCGLYLFNRPFTGTCSDRVIIPYAWLADILVGNDNRLILVDKEDAGEDWLRVTEAGQLASLYRLIKQALLRDAGNCCPQ